MFLKTSRILLNISTSPNSDLLKRLPTIFYHLFSILRCFFVFCFRMHTHYPVAHDNTNIFFVILTTYAVSRRISRFRFPIRTFRGRHFRTQQKHGLPILVFWNSEKNFPYEQCTPNRIRTIVHCTYIVHCPRLREIYFSVFVE